MDYKMIFSDMDGTLLKNDVAISEGNTKAIKTATEMGVDFVICTGRGVFGAERFLDQLGLVGKKGHVICQNGGAVYNLHDMSLSMYNAFRPNVFAPVVHFARSLGLELYYYDNRTFMSERITERVKKYCSVMRTQVDIVKEPLEYDGSFTKCLISGDREKLLLVQAEVKRVAGEHLDTFFSSPIFLEVVKKGVSKGNTMEETAKKVGVTLAEVIAIGDSDNDLSMIKKAGLGVAVQNAGQEIKDHADYVTTRTCAEDAVAEVIEKFIIG